MTNKLVDALPPRDLTYKGERPLGWQEAEIQAATAKAWEAIARRAVLSLQYIAAGKTRNPISEAESILKLIGNLPPVNGTGES